MSTQCCGPVSRGASQRPIARCRTRGRGSTSGPAGSRATDRPTSSARGPRRPPLAQVEPVGLTRIASGSSRRPRARRRRRTWSSTSPRASRAARGPPAQPPAQLGILEPAPERVASAPESSGRNEQTGPGSVGAVAQSLRHAADLGGDDRKPARERLGNDHPVALGARREDEHVRRARSCGRDRPPPAGRRSAPGRPSRASRPRRRSRSTKAGSRSRLPTHRHCQRKPVRARARRAGRRDLCPGSPRQPRAAPGGGRPGRELGGDRPRARPRGRARAGRSRAPAGSAGSRRWW